MTSLKKILLVSSLSVAAIAMSSAYAAGPSHHPANMTQLPSRANEIDQPASPIQIIIARLSPKQRQALYHDIGLAISHHAQGMAHSVQAVLAQHGARANVRITGPSGIVIADTAPKSTVGQYANQTPRWGERFGGYAVGVSPATGGGMGQALR